MIAYAKKSRLSPVIKNVFRVVAISKDNIDGAISIGSLYPSVDLIMKYNSGELKKKAFLKKYLKQISGKDTLQEKDIYFICKSLVEGNSIMLTATDEEYNLGYLKVLTRYIAEKLEIDANEYKALKENLSDAYDELALSKKEKKLINAEDELSDKKEKRRSKLLKQLRKTIKTEFDSTDWEEYSKKYAIDDIIYKLTANEVLTFSKNGDITNINVDNVGKKSKLIDAIETAFDSNKATRKTLKAVAESHDLKVKTKTFKKMETLELVNFIVECYTALLKMRAEQ